METISRVLGHKVLAAGLLLPSTLDSTQEGSESSEEEAGSGEQRNSMDVRKYNFHMTASHLWHLKRLDSPTWRWSSLL